MASTMNGCYTCINQGIGHKQIIDTDFIRLKFLEFCPCTVAAVDDIDLLKFLLRAYHPDVQPRNIDEWMYMGLVRDETQRRLEYLESITRTRPSHRGRYKFVELEKLDSVRRDLTKDFNDCDNDSNTSLECHADDLCGDALVDELPRSSTPIACHCDISIPLQFYDDVPEWLDSLR